MRKPNLQFGYIETPRPCAQIQFHAGSNPRPIASHVTLASNRMRREIDEIRPKTASDMIRMSETLRHEGFTEAAKYWREIVNFWYT